MRLLFMGLAMLLAFAIPAEAGDAAAGRKKMVKCQVCHGADGQSKNPEAPHITGQVERYIVKALKRYKSGERQDPMMSVVVQTLSDEDIADLAAYYSSIKVVIEKP
jgi:cytochrome c553